MRYAYKDGNRNVLKWITYFDIMIGGFLMCRKAYALAIKKLKAVELYVLYYLSFYCEDLFISIDTGMRDICIIL